MLNFVKLNTLPIPQKNGTHYVIRQLRAMGTGLWGVSFVGGILIARMGDRREEITVPQGYSAPAWSEFGVSYVSIR